MVLPAEPDRGLERMTPVTLIWLESALEEVFL